MKATNIKKNGKKLSAIEMQDLVNAIAKKLYDSCFITRVEVVNSSQIKIGLYMKSFVIDTERLPKNARVNNCTLNLRSGYKLTNSPTWDQRVEFNDIVNEVFDSFELDAKITAWHFTIRDFEGAKNEDLWSSQSGYNTGDVYLVEEARSIVSSDQREKEFDQKKKEREAIRRKENLAVDRELKSLNKIVVTAPSYFQCKNIKKKLGKTLSFEQFHAFLKTIAKHNRREVKRRSYETTLSTMPF